MLKLSVFTKLFTLVMLFWYPSLTVADSESTDLVDTYQLPIPSNVKNQLTHTLAQKSPEYTPRTEHLDATGAPLYTNRLILEASPYLLQHAHNPVNWFSWSEEALKLAKQKNKPLFISIGYSTCHWCHVMERESFENLPIAQHLNEHFISIKIDREQRPDIDHTYMMSAAMLSGFTGWPLNIFATPEGKPFYAATYFPPAQFMELLERSTLLWNNEPDVLIKEGERIIAAIKRIQTVSHSEERITEQTLSTATEQWLGIYDEFEGGFGTAPKFPQEPTLLFILDQALRNQDTLLLEMVTKALDAMQYGGIYDQIGGGFHRYATDPEWLIPHFEKMLYNQSQLARLYLLGYMTSGNPEYLRTLEATLEYVFRDMQTDAGVFYSATDAESEGKEGIYFIWSEAELRSLLSEGVLSEDEFRLAIQYYGFKEGPNFAGKNILFRPLSHTEFAIEHQLNNHALLQTLTSLKIKLLRYRYSRTPPHTDQKIITAWNSYLIRILADAGSYLQKTDYLNQAFKAADYLWETHYQPEGLIRDSSGENIGSNGNLEDYAALALANISLYEATFDNKWLNRAVILSDEIIQRFWDGDTSTLYFTSADQLSPIRSRHEVDQAIPAAESLAYELFRNLNRIQENQKYGFIADQLLITKRGKVTSNPMNFSYFLKVHAQGQKKLLPQQIGARGALRARLVRSDNQFKLITQLKPGWHINAHLPGDDRLIGSTVDADWMKETLYPQASTMEVAFMDKPLQLYSDRFEISFTHHPLNTLEKPLTFQYQACSKQLCLPPETLYFSPHLAINE